MKRVNGALVLEDEESTAISNAGFGQGAPSWEFPVGYVLISTVNTNPATFLGYGTWSAFGAGRVMVGLNAVDADFDTAEETGGAKTHTLTEAQLPAHTHPQGIRNSGTAGTAGTQGASTANNATAGTTGSTGSGQAFSLMNPYIVCYFWKRTA